MRSLHSLLVPTADGPQLVGAAPVVAIRTLLRRFWPDARPYRGRLALGLALAALVPAIETVEIYLFKLVVDDVLVPRELAALLPLALAYLGLALATAVISFADDYLAAWVGERFLLNLRTRVYAHVQGLSSHALDGRRLGDVLQRLTSDVQAIESFVLSGIGDGLVRRPADPLLRRRAVPALMAAGARLARRDAVVLPRRPALLAALQARGTGEAAAERLARRRGRGVAGQRGADPGARP